MANKPRLTPEALNGANGKGPETGAEFSAPEIPEIKPPEWPDLTEEGEPKRTYRNARAAIMALGLVCSYDEFHDRMLVAGHEINQWAGELSDAVNVVLRQPIIDNSSSTPARTTSPTPRPNSAWSTA